MATLYTRTTPDLDSEARFSPRCNKGVYAGDGRSSSNEVRSNVDYFSVPTTGRPTASPLQAFSTTLPFLTPAGAVPESPYNNFFHPSLVAQTPSQQTPGQKPYSSAAGPYSPAVGPSHGGPRGAPGQHIVINRAPGGARTPGALDTPGLPRHDTFNLSMPGTSAGLRKGPAAPSLPCGPASSVPNGDARDGSVNSVNVQKAAGPKDAVAFEPSQFASLLQSQTSASSANTHTVLGLDMRSYQHYSEFRICSSVNLSVPTMMLKRPACTPVKLFGALTSDHAKNVLKDWTKFENIIIYDDDSLNTAEGSPIVLLARKLQHANSTARIGWLQGGFTAFSEQYPDLCDSSPPPQGSESIAPNTNNITRGAPLNIGGPLTAPSALGALGAARPALLQPTYASHQSASELNADGMLADTIDVNNTHIPLFLRDLVRQGNVRRQIEQNFAIVEAAEKRRLDCAFRAQSRDDPFSVSDALEGGATRNRYNNIWPFNHNRVKLACDGQLTPDMREDGASLSPYKAATAEQHTRHNDYINASFIVSPAGHRLYIATQGPIASTFEDFWRMAWEQKSRIVLMLVADADVQRGSQTCHKYWPDEGHSMLYGRTRVTHEGEIPLLFGENRTPSAGGGTVVRQFRVVVDEREDKAETIWQVQYLGWPDHGVPKHPDEMLRVHYLVSTMCQRLDIKFGREEVGPVIVHCSAGCGRTGAFICVDAVLKAISTNHPMHADADNTPVQDQAPSAVTSLPSGGHEKSSSTPSDTWSTVRPVLTPTTFAPETSPHDMILATVHHLRSQRVLMVQSLSQYGFCYEIVARYCDVMERNAYDSVVQPTVVEGALEHMHLGEKQVDGVGI
ncbi:protein-tyrosine phosphatase-like protein [Fimicolochytrium jonesii]|uniref:protein-tyrosine phosphatase-like protein n=1 Tax=Fimicolochytrium jonesii TaxID=1396493 RepID=UPI0022FE5ADC|nr:protein-tyrosine phosphatase-like protein [Fimicolochytrium jonesii]KAI8824333.1 protein-tyrosine phosphatase-like protein [Fimicolochytrium jonesii]